MNMRRTEYCPPHFYAVDFDLSTNEKKIVNWIWSNLSGRFFFGDTFKVVSSEQYRKSHLHKRAAFEIHSEASYFAMLLNDINKF